MAAKKKSASKKLVVKKDSVKKLTDEDLKKVGGGARPEGGCSANCPGHGGTWIQGKTVTL